MSATAPVAHSAARRRRADRRRLLEERVDRLDHAFCLAARRGSRALTDLAWRRLVCAQADLSYLTKTTPEEA